MFLLTDGQDRNATAEKLELARKMKSNGTSLFVFGFGTDHDSEHMVRIQLIHPYLKTYPFKCFINHHLLKRMRLRMQRRVFSRT